MDRTCSPEDGVVEEGELHLCVVLQRGPATRSGDVDVGHVERNLHRQERLGRVPHLGGERGSKGVYRVLEASNHL